ncbi:MAG: EscU/YscU/HrcU family type III secretion system export apparatus switch protein [Alphaproteobacteria bacterium]|nr:EscU/YscU/HrcU family type III secretion system export apparatus switch protein [Alphaproteobacteria bacterium]MDE2336532.1 EscU/YscU/HrcU family type III secretion system export apparatus switch protein [Alphaproteobacteria bacterium]
MVDIFDDSAENAEKDRAAAAESRRQTAVALKKFGIDESAIPKVVAAGYGKLAEEIVRLAFENGVKVREDKDLAQILAAIELDSEIPSEALVAIAEILSYVYKVNSAYQPVKEDNEG